MFLAQLRAESSILNARQKQPKAELQIFKVKPTGLPAGLFNALREWLASRAKATEPGRDVNDAVTPISALRGGERPVDYFSVSDDGLVNEIIGEGVLNIHSATGSAVKMVAPLEFSLHAKRDMVTGTLGQVRLTPSHPTTPNTTPRQTPPPPAQVMSLVVKVHVVALVPDHSHQGFPKFRRDDTTFEYPEADIAAYKVSMARGLMAMPAGSVPHELRGWAQAKLA